MSNILGRGLWKTKNVVEYATCGKLIKINNYQKMSNYEKLYANL